MWPFAWISRHGDVGVDQRKGIGPASLGGLGDGHHVGHVGGQLGDDRPAEVFPDGLDEPPAAGFPQTLNETVSCLRPCIRVNGTLVAAQVVTMDNSSVTVGCAFAHLGDAACG